MSKPMIRIHNTETDEVIDREMTNDEFAQYKKDIERIQKQLVKSEERKIVRQSLLEKLGLTEDEANLLLG